MIREIDEKIEQTIKKLRNNSEEAPETKRIPAKMYESIYPLNAGTGIYKGNAQQGLFLLMENELTPDMEKSDGRNPEGLL